MREIRREHLRKIITFLAVGGGSALIYFAVAEVGHSLGAPTFLASATGYICTIPISYLGHKKWTYRAHRRDKGEKMRFIVNASLCFLLSAIVPRLVIHMTGAPAAVAFWATCLAVWTLSFLMLQFWVFFGASSATLPGTPP